MTKRPTTTNQTALALAVWPPSQSHPGTYLSASRGRHRIAPEIAARAISAYTDPGDLVIDPHCGIGTVLVEAITCGRRAIGVEPSRRNTVLATANISHARDQGAPGRAAVIEGNPADLPRLLTKAAAILNPARAVRRHPAGSSQLILTHLAAPPRAALLAAWRRVLAPGGLLLLVHTPSADQQPPGLGGIVQAAEQVGLEYWQHVIALQTAQGTELAHTDVVAFRKPHPTPNAAAVRPRVPQQRRAAA